MNADEFPQKLSSESYLSQLGMLQHEWGRVLFRLNPVHVVGRDGATLVSVVVAKSIKTLGIKVNLQSSTSVLASFFHLRRRLCKIPVF
jgi:hypothetical protein